MTKYDEIQAHEEYLMDLWCERQETIGVYAVKSPYHKSIYLPFAIVGYSDTKQAYDVCTVEYKGMKPYKVDTHYSEKVIKELIDNGVIIRKGRFADMDKPSLRTLVRRYTNANEPLI